MLKFNIKIEENKQKIASQKNPIDKIVKSIPEDEDFLNKISLEKKSLVDSLAEDVIIKLTYENGFEFDYQYDLMQILLQEINKFRFDERVKQRVEAECQQLSPELQLGEGQKMRKAMITENFKHTCFDAWKFKNLILSLEGINVINKQDIDNLKDRLDKIRQTAFSIPNDIYFEPFFEKVYKLLKVLLFLTVGQKRIDTSKTKLKSLKDEEAKSNLLNAEYSGKIILLQNIKKRIQEESSKGEEVSIKKSHAEEVSINQDLKEFIKELKGIKNTLQLSFNSFLKQLGDNLIKPQDLDYQ